MHAAQLCPISTVAAQPRPTARQTRPALSGTVVNSQHPLAVIVRNVQQ